MWDFMVYNLCETYAFSKTILQICVHMCIYNNRHVNSVISGHCTTFFLTPRAAYKGTLCDAFIET